MDKNKKLEKESDLNQEDESAREKLKTKKLIPFFWTKNYLATRRKRTEALQEAQEKLYRKDILEGTISKLKEDEAQAVFQAIDDAEATEVVAGVDMGEFDVATFLKAYIENRSIHLVTFRPSLADHDVVTGNLGQITNIEKICLEVGHFLVAEFPNSTPLLVLDEYGEYTDEAKKTFRDQSVEIMRQHQLVAKNAVEGKEFLVVTGSELASKADELIAKLEKDSKLAQKGILTREGEMITYTLRVPYVPAHREIVLRDNNGRWTPETLGIVLSMEDIDTASCQAVCRPRSAKLEEGRIWEILSLLGFNPENYNNLYFDPSLRPEEVVGVIGHKFAQELERFTDEKRELLGKD